MGDPGSGGDRLEADRARDDKPVGEARQEALDAAERSGCLGRVNAAWKGEPEGLAVAASFG